MVGFKEKLCTASVYYFHSDCKSFILYPLEAPYCPHVHTGDDVRLTFEFSMESLKYGHRNGIKCLK